MKKKLDNKVYEKYCSQGYVLSRSIIDQDQCNKLREYVKKLIDKNPKDKKNILLHSKCIKDLSNLPRTNQLLKQIINAVNAILQISSLGDLQLSLSVSK